MKRLSTPPIEPSKDDIPAIAAAIPALLQKGIDEPIAIAMQLQTHIPLVKAALQELEQAKEIKYDSQTESYNQKPVIRQTYQPRRRKRGQGSGTIIKRLIKGKYQQLFYQIEYGGQKKSIYIPKRIERRILQMNQDRRPVKEILKAINSPKSQQVKENYRQWLLKK